MGLHIDHVYVLWRKQARGEFIDIFLTLDGAQRHALGYLDPHGYDGLKVEWEFLEGQVTRYPQWVDGHGFYITKERLGD